MSGQTSPQRTEKKRTSAAFREQAGKGRPKGVRNKTTTAVKDMVIQALNEADPRGGIEYLKKQATANPAAFLTLVGKVIPLQVAGSGSDGAHVHRIELVGVMPK